MPPSACCCCFSGSVRILILLVSLLAFSCLYSSLLLFPLTGLLHKELNPSLRPLPGLESLHESTIWIRRKRNANFTVDSSNLADYVDAIAEKFDDQDEDGHPILPPQPPTAKPVPTTTVASRRTGKPETRYITNAPNIQTSTTRPEKNRTTGRQKEKEKGTTRGKAVETTPTSTAIAEDFEDEAEPANEKTEDLKPSEPVNTRADKEEMDEEAVVKNITPTLKEKLLRALIYAAPGIGCLLFLFPSMFLIKRFGVRLVVALALVLAAISALLATFLSQYGALALIPARLLEGVAFSVVFPAMGSVTVHWATLSEQLFFIAFFFLFVTIGPLMAWPLSSVLSSNEVDFLYINCGFSGLYLLTALIFYIFYRDRPQYHPWVNGIELNRIVAGKVHQLQLSRTPSSPFRLLIRSRSAWAIWISVFAFFTPIALFAIYLPSMLVQQEIFFVDHEPGLYPALAFVAFPVVYLLSGVLNRSSCATSTAHVRIFNSLALALTVCTLLLFPIAVILEFMQIWLLPIFLLPLGLGISGFLRSLVLVGRLYSQHILSYCGLFCALAFTILPFVVCNIVTENQIFKFIPVFTFCIASLLVGTIVFAFLGRGKNAQSWDPLMKGRMNDLQLIDVSKDECGLYELTRLSPSADKQ